MIVLIGLIGLGFTNCKTIRPTARPETPAVKLYNPTIDQLHPDYKLYHSNIDETTLFFRIFTQELLFNQANPEVRDQSRVELSYILYSSFSEKIIQETGSKEFVINKDQASSNYTGSLKIPTEEGKSYFLEVNMQDKIRQSTSKHFLLVDRFNPKSQQNFLLLNYPGNEIAFESFFYPEESFRILSSNPPGKSVRVAYYKPIRKLPAPPFSVDTEGTNLSDPAPDSLWTLETNDQTLFQVADPGIYQFFPIEGSLNGVVVTNFGDNHPQMKAPEDMLPPLQYLTSSAEYKEILAKKNRKEALDEYWLDLSGSFSAGKEMIRVYYNRVVFANLYFSTDQPGWKTDRGMIYLVMGAPDNVNVTETGESWSYKQSGSNQKYTFEFYLDSDPLLGYRFVLRRTENHRSLWTLATQTWRQGKIFSL